jgi:type 1 fimbria pilin
MKKIAVITAALVSASLFFTATVRAQDEHTDQDDEAVTVKGEVVDLACYLGHGAQGKDHAACAKTCIESGLPVGIKTADGKTYILIGEHKPLNKELAPYAAKTITVKGKVSERDGLRMLSNVEIVK